MNTHTIQMVPNPITHDDHGFCPAQGDYLLKNTIKNFTLVLQGFPQVVNAPDPVAALEARIMDRFSTTVGAHATVRLLRWAVVAVNREDAAGGFTCEGAFWHGPARLAGR